MEIKLSYVMNVLNGEPFIKYQLDSIYKHAHKIIIVEGAYEKFKHAATTDGHSTDRTVYIIKDYPDPLKKIILITKPGFYDDRLDMCNEFMGRVTGNVIWQVDVDEFYHQEAHDYIKKCFENDENLDRVSFNFYDLFASPDYYIYGYEALKLTNVNRVHRYTPGDRWLNQRPPLLCNKNGVKKVINKHMGGDELEKHGHVMFNCTAIYRKQIEDKYKYHSTMWGNVSKPDNYLDAVWDSFKNRYFLSGHKNSITYLKQIDVSVPKEVDKVWQDILKDSNYNGQRRDNTDIERYFNSREYLIYDEIANSIISFQQSQNYNPFKAFKDLIAIIKKLPYLNKVTKKHAKKVLVNSLIKKFLIFFKNILYDTTVYRKIINKLG